MLAEKVDINPEAIRFSDGKLVAGEHHYSLSSVAELMKSEGLGSCVRYKYQAPATVSLGEGGDTHIAYSFAAQAAEVAVDIRTGEVRVLQVITANDVGRCLNPLGLQGQAEGGVIMGIGGALLEEFIVENGVVFTDRMARYRIPSIQDSPQITSFVVEHPTRDGPYGAKGVGEIAGIPTAPAIVNAIYNAVGVRLDKLPLHQEDIWQAMKAAENTSL
jgi:xanthine dehydrogenase molybdenum-binding subunit